jgi:hypothetical protein
MSNFRTLSRGIVWIKFQNIIRCSHFHSPI